MVPQSTVTISDERDARKIIALMEELEDHEDVQTVATNLEIPDGFEMTE
jgi:transcriptional/translational regulatory protein YebC/TACO1